MTMPNDDLGWCAFWMMCQYALYLFPEGQVIVEHAGRLRMVRSAA